ncbi:MAG: PTS IIA-like nitrogen regulatory protein PtsN [Alphaproteobacteria bacterium]
MEIAELLNEQSIIPTLKVGSKKQALQEMAHRAAALTGLEERRIFDVLLERERLGTTGVGHGIAIPHGKLAELEQLHGLFVRLNGAIDFDAIDDEPVDLIFMLLAPESAGADHLKALARISRLLRDESVCAKLRSLDQAETIYAVLTDPAGAGDGGNGSGSSSGNGHAAS